MLSDTQKTFVFALLMCLFCSIALTGTAVGLKSKQEKNMLVDRQKNILKSLNLLDVNKKYSSLDIEKLYIENVNEFYVNDLGELTADVTSLPLFVIGSETSIEKYAVPFKAYGLWSWVYGYIAIQGDGETIVGLTVYDHKETPGLGGEVEKAWFQNQFIGKKITDISGEFVSIGVVKGKVKDSNIAEDKLDNYVDGISGATITSKGVEKYLKDDLYLYETFAKQLRRS